jgi:hypothetical protein
MNTVRWAGLILIVVGSLGLAWGSFSYTKSTHEAQIGPLELKVQERQTINVPAWAGAGAIGVGVLLLMFGGRKV